MRIHRSFFIGLVLVIIAAMAAYGQLDPWRIQDEREGIPGPRFSLENGLYRMSQIRRGLRAYDTLFSNCRRLLSGQQCSQVVAGTNIAGDERTIGFANWPTTVEVTLKRQSLIIKKLEYELAQERFNLGNIDQEELVTAQRDYTEADSTFRYYIKNIHWSD